MKQTVLFFFFLLFVPALFAQSYQWTWMSGDSSSSQSGVYGTKGMAASINKPGTRQNAAKWNDAYGNLWLFGGQGNSNSFGFLNDLWKYSTSTGLWTWVSGDNISNAPGIYGARGMASSTNKPGARSGAVSWMDASGNLWLLGGESYINGGYKNLNDLWMYSTATSRWIWKGGDSTVYQAGVYGTKGTAATANKPGARHGGVSWTDASGDFWLFGGAGTATNTFGDLNDLWKYTLSSGQWTWISGDSSASQLGVYGIQSAAASANKPGGRLLAVSWADTSGHLWMFGGSGYASNGSGNLNDLWMFSPSTAQWTWMSGDKTVVRDGVYGPKGTANYTNKPGGRYGSISWTDSSGNLWLFGGLGNAGFNTNVHFNDLWKYAPLTSQWTWISGDSTADQSGVYGIKGTAASTNKPGSRSRSLNWTDVTGNLWLFGGVRYSTYSNGYSNDLWKYSLSTGQWTWMSGDSTFYQPSIYGKKSTPDSANNPGARSGVITWTDASDNLWLFGGYVASPIGYGDLNDLWKYSPSSGLWTWISGDSTVLPSGIYGTKGTPASGNKPESRYEAVSWTDATGNLWMFGGSTYKSGAPTSLNDLWRYNILTGLWTWMSGDSTFLQPSVYGTKGIAAVVNKPGARYGAVSWTDASGSLWLFGGNGVSSLNDLWKYTPSTGLWTWMSGDSTSNQAGVYGTKGMVATANKPGARFRAVNWTDASGNLWLFGGNGYAALGKGYLNDLWKYSPSSGLWTWVSGDNTVTNQGGVYGTKGVAASTNKPGGRFSAVSWSDISGNLWLFGGFGPSSNAGNLNDLWKFVPSTGWWTWIEGDNLPNQPSVYGIKSIAAPNNKPGARQNSGKWADSFGNLWLFGGYGYVSNITERLNDLWKYSASGTSLPVKFRSFTAQKQPHAVLLNWTTAQEQNSRYFVVERSPRGIVYDSIAQVTAAGTSSSATSYVFTDMVPLPGTSFYRLKQLDKDSRFMYSAVVKVVMDDNARFTVIQNPVQNTLQLEVQLPAAQQMTFKVSDISGRVLLSKEQKGSKGISMYSLSVNHLAKGTYVISMKIGNVNSTKTFVIQ